MNGPTAARALPTRRPQNPAASPGLALSAGSKFAPSGCLAIHTTTTAFDGATLTDTGAFSPDSFNTVGPMQFSAAAVVGEESPIRRRDAALAHWATERVAQTVTR